MNRRQANPLRLGKPVSDHATRSRATKPTISKEGLAACFLHKKLGRRVTKGEASDNTCKSPSLHLVRTTMTMRYLLAALALTAIATDSEAGPFRRRAQSAYQPTYQPVYEANSSVPSTPARRRVCGQLHARDHDQPRFHQLFDRRWPGRGQRQAGRQWAPAVHSR